jgi:hypothetical protein
VCKAISGCPVNINTGECPTCINEKRKVNRESVLKKKKIVKVHKSSHRFLMDCELCVGYLEKWRK